MTDKNFLRNILVTRGDPLVCACPRLRSSRCRQTNVESSSLYFWSIWEQHVFFLIIVHSRMKIYEVLKRAPTCSYPLFDWYYHYSASLVLKRVRIRCCARRCGCKVLSGRWCISSAVLAHYSIGTTSLLMKGMPRRFCCKVFSGKQRRKNAVVLATQVVHSLLGVERHSGTVTGLPCSYYFASQQVQRTSCFSDMKI